MADKSMKENGIKIGVQEFYFMASFFYRTIIKDYILFGKGLFCYSSINIFSVDIKDRFGMLLRSGCNYYIILCLVRRYEGIFWYFHNGPTI